MIALFDDEAGSGSTPYMKITIDFLLASVVFPAVTPAQAPVFEFTRVESAMKFEGTGTVKGTMAFDRKDYGMNKGIPLVKIADRVEVSVDLKGKRVSGPPVVFTQ